MEDLPEPLMVDILSRLPAKTIIHCKCVCKKWLNLVLEPYFANLHFSRAPAVLMIHHPDSGNEMTGYCAPGILKWVEVEDQLDHHHLYHDPIMSLDLNLAPDFQNSQIYPVSSVNGLLCLWQFGPKPWQSDPKHDNTFIFNPITREYINLPRQQSYRCDTEMMIMYSFGVGSVTQEYKVVRTFTSTSRSDLLEAEVYTLGTGRWRSVGRVPYRFKGIYGTFLNGHAHWIVVDEDSPEKLCVFDFDKETFKLFPSPPSEADIEESIEECLGVIKGCLCECVPNLSNKFTVWVMKEYGIKKSWHKELVVQHSISYDLGWPVLQPLYIIEGLKDGTILMASDEEALFVYCPQRNIIVDKEIFDCYFRGFAFRPSFHRLQNFENETVHVF